ncbi:MAG TPA: porin [Gemmatimonadales bacterium]|nr:porin [Gemmatimonadales bacterium]
MCLALLLGAPVNPRPATAQYPPATPPPVPGPAPVKLSGYLQGREVYQSEIGLTGSINRARLTASGGIVEAVAWRVQGEFRTGSVGTGRASVSLQDAYIRYAPGRWAMQVGQFKTPFTREFMTSLSDVETADRATAVDSLAPKRDIGVMDESLASSSVA